MFPHRLQPVQKREAGVTANVLLSLIDRMKGDVSSLPIRYSQIEAYAYNTHGRIALDEGTDESARRAVVHFGNELQVNKAVGDNEGIAAAKGNILTTYQELYDLRVAELGDEHEHMNTQLNQVKTMILHSGMQSVGRRGGDY